MFNNSSFDAVEKGFSYLERLFEMFIRLLEALFGGSSATTTAPETTAPTTEATPVDP